MALQFRAAQNAVADLVSAALLGEGWEQGLESLASACGAGGATLMRLRDGRALACLSSSGWVEADAALKDGRAPPSSRQFFPDRAFTWGFLVDADLFTEDDLNRDPYYQDFLKPRGVFWHAKARLCKDAGERVTLSLKRDLRFGPYNSEEVAVLDSLLPDLTAAIRIGRRVLDAEASGMACAMHRRGEAVLELDAWGRVRRVHTDERQMSGITVRDGRLVMKDQARQPALERALRSVLRDPRRAAALMVTDHAHARSILQLVPVGGRARDVFGATAALGLLIASTRPPAPARNRELIAGAFGLTGREAQVAVYLSQGMSLAEVAEHLHVQIGTVRNHLKSIFEKSGARRQGELVALLARLGA